MEDQEGVSKSDVSFDLLFLVDLAKESVWIMRSQDMHCGGQDL